MRSFAPAGPALTLLLLAACTAGDATDGDSRITDSAGVALVAVTAEDRPLDWTLTELFRLGGAEEGPGSFTTAYSGTVGTDAQGRIYVLDDREFRVEVFDRDGRHLRFLGRKGSGPGELDHPGFLVVESGGVVNVFDYAKLALVRWGPDGEILPIARSDARFTAGPPAIQGDTMVHVRQAYGERSRGANLRIMTPTDTIDLPGIENPTTGMVMFSCVGLNSPPLFARAVAFAAAGGRIAVTHQVPYQVDLYEGFRLVRSIRRAVLVEAPTAAHVERLYPEGMKVGFGGGGSCTVPAAELFEKQGVAPHLPLIKLVALGPRGVLWVERYTFPREPGRLDLFDREGRYLGTLTGKRLPLGFVGEDVVLFPDEDVATGVIQVVAYRIGGQ